MKKRIITGISLIACVALCAVVPPWGAVVEDLPAKPVKAAVTAEIEARSEETPHIFISEVTPALETEVVAESNSPKTEITAEKETEKAAPAQTAEQVKPAASSSEPHNGDVRVVDGEKQVYLLGFGWLKDEGGGSIGTMVGSPGDQLTGHKVGIMGNRTVGSDGDINKQIGTMGGGTVAADMYENGHKIGIMDGSESVPSSSPSQSTSEPEITGDVIYTELQPPVTKDSTPPAYKPNGEPYTP